MSLLSRRASRLLAALTIGVIAAAGSVVVGQTADAATSYPYTLASDKIRASFAADGSMQSLKIVGDRHDTEYLMNPDSAPEQAREANSKYRQWFGNLMFSYANGTGAVSTTGVGANPWKTAWTSQSADGRTVSATSSSVTVTHQNSTNAEGVKGFTVTETYSLASDGSLVWKQDVKNTAATQLVIGDWGVPVPGNELWRQGDSDLRDPGPHTLLRG